MLRFSEWASGEAEAHRFVRGLLEAAAESEQFVLTEEELEKMGSILEVYPDILKSGIKVQYIGRKSKRADLDYLDRKEYARSRRLR